MKSTRHVLIVEDEPIIRHTLREFLTGEGFLVAEAGTIADALTQVRQRDFAVAICDVRLPDGDGIGLLKRLLQLNPDLFVLIITAYATVAFGLQLLIKGLVGLQLINASTRCNSLGMAILRWRDRHPDRLI